MGPSLDLGGSVTNKKSIKYQYGPDGGCPNNCGARAIVIDAPEAEIPSIVRGRIGQQLVSKCCWCLTYWYREGSFREGMFRHRYVVIGQSNEDKELFWPVLTAQSRTENYPRELPSAAHEGRRS